MDISKKNCINWSFCHAVNLMGGQINEYEMFLSCGGIQLKCNINSDNPLLELTELEGCIVNEKLLCKNTGIEVVLLKTDKDNLNNIFSTIKQNQSQMGFVVDVFMLPFDKINYLKNSGTHIIFVQKFENGKWQVWDNKYNALLSENELIKAITYCGDVKYFTVDINNMYDRNTMLNNINSSLKNNWIKIQSSSNEQLSLFLGELSKTNEKNEPFRGIELQHTIRSLQKTNSISYAFYMTAKYLDSDERFMSLYEQFRILPYKIARLINSHEKIDDIKEAVDRIKADISNINILERINNDVIR